MKALPYLQELLEDCLLRKDPVTLMRLIAHALVASGPAAKRPILITTVVAIIPKLRIMGRDIDPDVDEFCQTSDIPELADGHFFGSFRSKNTGSGSMAHA